MNPLDYFNSNYLNESLVLKYGYNASSRTVIVVFDLADRALSKAEHEYKINPEREIHKLSFMEVSSYDRRNIANIYKTNDNYDASSDVGSFCMYDVSCNKTIDGLEFKASFGSFGEIFFHYKKLTVEKKILRPYRRSVNEFFYRDIENGNVVDFYNPFND